MNGASAAASGSLSHREALLFLPPEPAEIRGQKPHGSGKHGQRRVQPFAGALHAHASGLLGKTPLTPPPQADPLITQLTAALMCFKRAT